MKKIIFLFTMFLFCINLFSQEEVKLKNGRTIIVKLDGTWIFKQDISDNNTVTDIDGNVYHTIVIGTQIWMVENLRVTHYQNGDPLAHIGYYENWLNYSSGAYSKMLTNNIDALGYYYNWYAATDLRNIAPKGWHVASDAEWNILIEFLGGNKIAAGKLKETGTANWDYFDVGATNETGFSALPAGYRESDDGTGNSGVLAAWWCSNKVVKNNQGKTKSIRDSSRPIESKELPKFLGLSVRCIKD